MNNGMDTLLNLFFRGEPLEKIPGGVKLAEAASAFGTDRSQRCEGRARHTDAEGWARKFPVDDFDVPVSGIREEGGEESAGIRTDGF